MIQSFQQLRPSFDVFSLEDLVQTVVAQNEMNAERKSIRLRVECQDVQIWGDERMLSQALNNLVNNAIKFSPSGTETFVWTEARGNFYRISVHDQGPGIPEEDREQLFGMFSKLSNRPTGGESSTGLGLWIVRQLIDLHGGDCGMDTPDDGGSIFWMEVLVANDEQIATAFTKED